MVRSFELPHLARRHIWQAGAADLGAQQPGLSGRGAQDQLRLRRAIGKELAGVKRDAGRLVDVLAAGDARRTLQDRLEAREARSAVLEAAPSSTRQPTSRCRRIRRWQRSIAA